jgi:hypothetical protein
VPDLVASIEEGANVHSNEPKHRAWSATAESILTKLRRGRVALDHAVSE